MSELAEWSDLIRKQGEEHRAREDERINRMATELPTAVAGLTSRENSELLALYNQFHGSGYGRREDKLRETFRNAVEAEILRRMTLTQRD